MNVKAVTIDNPAVPPVPVAMTSKLGQAVQEQIAKAVVKVAAEPSTPVTVSESGRIATEVLGQLAKDPAFVNATNSEAWYQSGVAMGLNGVTAGALAIVAPMLFVHGFHFDQWDWAVAGPALFILASAAFGYARRFIPGLKPLFSGK